MNDPELDTVDSTDPATDFLDDPGMEGESGAPERPPANQSTLILVGLILIGACVIYFMYFKKGPASAEASTSAETEAATETINQFLTAGGENIRLMHQLLSSTERVVQQFQNYPSAAQVPLSDLKTNPFRHAIPRINDPSASDELLRQKRAQERQAILAAVQALQLSMIMHNESRPACIINNTMYNENDRVGMFTIDQIAPGSVIVKSGAYRFELRMQP